MSMRCPLTPNCEWITNYLSRNFLRNRRIRRKLEDKFVRKPFCLWQSHGPLMLEQLTVKDTLSGLAFRQLSSKLPQLGTHHSVQTWQDLQQQHNLGLSSLVSPPPSCVCEGCSDWPLTQQLERLCDWRFDNSTHWLGH